MGRTIEFDYDQAIDRATRLFWKTGYSNTSLRALLKTMKLGEGSFYNSVKSKKHLFLECLKHYRETIGRQRETAFFSEPSVKCGIRALFKTLLDQLDDPSSPRSCLMASSLSREVLEEPDLRNYILGEMAEFGGQFVERLKAAQDSGELPKKFAPEAVAQIVGTYIQGVLRMAPLFRDRRQLEIQIEIFLASLGF